MAEVDLEQCVEVGKVGKAHGIRGDFKVLSYSDQPENFSDYTTIILQDAAGSLQSLTIDKARVQGRMAVLTSTTITDRTQAEALTGQRIWVEASQLPALDADEFYWHDIIGAQVVSSSGEAIGVLNHIFAAGGLDMLVVMAGAEEVLIPAQPEFLVEVGADKVIVELPPGLLELNKKK